MKRYVTNKAGTKLKKMNFTVGGVRFGTTKQLSAIPHVLALHKKRGLKHAAVAMVLTPQRITCACIWFLLCKLICIISEDGRVLWDLRHVCSFQTRPEDSQSGEKYCFSKGNGHTCDADHLTFRRSFIIKDASASIASRYC